MKDLYRCVALMWVVLGSFSVAGQTVSDSAIAPVNSAEVVLLKPFTIDAKVISLLQGHSDLAVLQLTRAEANEWDLKRGDEILVKFRFGNKGPKSVKGGDLIRAEIVGQLNKNTVQVDYSLMRFSILASPIDASEIPAHHKSSK